MREGLARSKIPEEYANGLLVVPFWRVSGIMTLEAFTTDLCICYIYLQKLQPEQCGVLRTKVQRDLINCVQRTMYFYARFKEDYSKRAQKIFKTLRHEHYNPFNKIYNERKQVK